MSASTLKAIKERLDKCGSKADYDALSDHLSKLIHDYEVARNPRLREKEMQDQRKVEARILVNRMKARVDGLKEGKKSGKFEDNSSEFRKGLSKAEEDLSFAEEQLARLG